MVTWAAVEIQFPVYSEKLVLSRVRAVQSARSLFGNMFCPL